MATLTFDTYDFIERLIGTGMPEAQAKAIADGLRDVELGDVATKADVLSVRDELRVEVANVKFELIKWLVPLLLGQAALIVALVRLL